MTEFNVDAEFAKLPRNWKRAIARLTGLRFCDRDCGCGANNQLWWLPPMGERAWVPAWMNGADTDEIWEWLSANGRTE